MLVNMAMSDEERQEQYGDDASPDLPKYPYGLRLDLDDDALEKLGITSLPDVGTKMMITCQVEVCSTGAYQTAGSEKETSLGLQITDMEIGNSPTATTDAKSASLLYP